MRLHLSETSPTQFLYLVTLRVSDTTISRDDSLLLARSREDFEFIRRLALQRGSLARARTIADKIVKITSELSRFPSGRKVERPWIQFLSSVHYRCVRYIVMGCSLTRHMILFMEITAAVYLQQGPWMPFIRRSLILLGKLGWQTNGKRNRRESLEYFNQK